MKREGRKERSYEGGIRRTDMRYMKREGRKEGRREGRNEGKEGRKEGRKEP